MNYFNIFLVTVSSGNASPEDASVEVMATTVSVDNLREMSQGKLIEIHFSETGKISGANIKTCKFTPIVDLELSCAYSSFGIVC